MTPKTASDRLARAASILAAHAPPILSTQVPAGLAIATPETWPDGDAVALYLVPAGHGLRLVDDGCVVPALDASGALPEDGSWRRTLDGAGLSFDDDAYEIYADVTDIDGLPERVLSMARAVRSLGSAGDGAA